MEGKPRHALVLKRGDLKIELVSDDAYFITHQLVKWFRDLADPELSLPPPPLPSNSPDLPPMNKPGNQAASSRVPELPAELQQRQQPRAMPESTAERFETTQKEESVLERVLNEPPAPPEPEPEPAPATPAGLNADVRNDFESVMATLLEDLNDEKTAPANDDADTKAGGGDDEQNAIRSLDDLLKRADEPESQSDYLMLALYYLTYFEGVEKFTLKQVNSLMIQHNLTPVNHGLIEQNVRENRLQMVPDLTGTAEANEYRLTPVGESHASKLLGKVGATR